MKILRKIREGSPAPKKRTRSADLEMSDRLSEIESELESLFRRIQRIGTRVEQSFEQAEEQAEINEKIGRLEREQAELIRSKE